MDLTPEGCCVVADKGHRGEHDVIRVQNALDDDEVAEFKSMALAHHKNFNSGLQ